MKGKERKCELVIMGRDDIELGSIGPTSRGTKDLAAELAYSQSMTRLGAQKILTPFHTVTKIFVRISYASIISI